MSLAAVPIKQNENPKSGRKDDLLMNTEYAHYQRKPSDLPLYAPLHSYNRPTRLTHPQNNDASSIRKILESNIGIVRSEIQAVLYSLREQKDVISDYITTARLHTQSTIDYLNEPQNILPRSGAIAMGGLAGFLFGIRGGIIKKFFYTSMGAGILASLCYPRQAEQLAQEALYHGRKGYAITYNFIKGTKPGEKLTIEPINKFPTSLEDVKFLIYDIYDEAKEALFPQKKK